MSEEYILHLIPLPPSQRRKLVFLFKEKNEVKKETTVNWWGN